ncbi:MAG: SBBP repeat-containing protein [Promethearchaeota archaeon]
MRKTRFFTLVGSIMLFFGLVLSVWFGNLAVTTLNFDLIETTDIASTSSVFSILKSEEVPISDLLISSAEKSVKIPFNGFIRNLGQWNDPSIHYRAMERDLTLLFGISSINYDSVSQNTDVVQVSVSFPGSNPINPVGRDKAGHSINYFYGDVQITNVPAYMEIWYPELYPGIDLRYYMSDQGLKYDFVVYPGADPNQIAIQVSQSMRLTIEDQTVSLRSRSQHELVYFQDTQLRAWQADGTPVFTQFVSKAMSPNTYGFQVEAFDSTQILTIDPLLLAFSSFIGGSDSDYVYSIAVDTAGNSYITGTTWSSDFPTQTPYNNTLSGDYDVFVTKLNATGNGLIFSTYIGGSEPEEGRGISVEVSGNIYITGFTNSTNLPTKHAYQSDFSGQLQDVFVTKLNATGNGLIFSTYLGGSDNDRGYDITVDNDGNSYIAGFTDSNDFPIENAYNSTHSGSNDVFVTKLNATGNGLVFSTYIGGNNGDYGWSIAIDPVGNTYITGGTDSDDFPIQNALQSTRGESRDVFVTKLNTTGNGLIFSTFIGGEAWDSGRGITTDADGNSYVTGEAFSDEFPIYNAYQINESLGGTGAFITKLNTTGGFVFSTLLGNTGLERGDSIAVDTARNSYITGSTWYYNSSSGWRYDAFVAELNATGNGLMLNKYLGGSGNDIGRGIAVDDVGNIYITGTTESSDFPTQNAYDSTYNGGTDSFVTKLYYFEAPTITLISPLNNSIQQSGTLIDLNIMDNDGVSLVLYNWDGSANLTLGAPYDLTLPAGEGYHELNIYANDSLDNRAYEVFLFTTDDTNPTIVLKTPANDSIHPSSAMISLNITDVYGISQVSYNWDGTSNNSISAPYDIALIIGDGQHFLHVYASDNAGNWAYTLFMFTTDDNAPIITLRSPVNGSTQPENTIIDLNVVDTVAISHVFYHWDGNANTTLTVPYDVVLPTSEGQHTLYVYANDTIGHWAVAMYIFTTSTPIITTITTPIVTTIITTVATDFFTIEVFLVAFGALTVVLWRRKKFKVK